MLLTAALLAATAGSPPADLAAVDRTIRKEPAYKTKAPRYGLLVFGPRAEHRVWLVWDGETLYVDRNGDGDLTQPGEAVAAKKRDNSDDECLGFEVGELRTGGLMHHEVEVSVALVSSFSPAFTTRPDIKAILARDPKARAFTVSAEVQFPGLKGGAPGGRVLQMTSAVDLEGVLLFADRPADAPVIHFGGPLQVTFYGERPTARLGRDLDLVLCVGTPGRGPGTFAMVGYEDLIPEKAFPRVEITFPAKVPGEPPIKELYELKGRC
jgi:hypothetical protein